MDKIINPLVSVLIPVYNGERYISESIDSILNQTYPNLEIIIIDDGSTDQTQKKILSLKTNRIKCYKNDVNRGLIYSLNFGITKCSGSFIARMDADDIAHCSRIEKQVRFLQENSIIDVCGTWFTTFGANRCNDINHPTTHQQIKYNLLFYSPIGHPTVMFRRLKFQESKSFYYCPEFIHNEDYELWTRLIFEYKFANLPNYLLKYRMHNNQISELNNQAQRLGSDVIRIKYFRNLFLINQDITDEEILKALNFEYVKSFSNIIRLAYILFQINKNNIMKNRSFSPIFLLLKSANILIKNVI